MAQIIDIRRVEVGPRSLTARVRVATTAPLFTSEDLEGTARVYRLMPHIIEHACLGDAGATFKDVMGDTEIAHLLEHVTVELLAQSDIAGDISCGRTYEVSDERRTYDVEIDCVDDVLVAGALSSAVWILQWAYSGGTDPEPDVEATVQGLVGLVQTLPEPKESGPSVVEYVISEEEAEQLIAENGIFDNEPLEEYEGIERLDEPEGAAPDEGPITPDGVRESPEARQASQDVPAPRLNPEVVPDVAEKLPMDEEDPFEEPIPVEEREIPDASYEPVVEDEAEQAHEERHETVIDERLVDEIMAAPLPNMAADADRQTYEAPRVETPAPEAVAEDGLSAEPKSATSESEPEAATDGPAPEPAEQLAAEVVSTEEGPAAEAAPEEAAAEGESFADDANSASQTEADLSPEPAVEPEQSPEPAADPEPAPAPEPESATDPEPEYVAPGASSLEEVLHPASAIAVEAEVEAAVAPEPAEDAAASETPEPEAAPIPTDDAAEDQSADAPADRPSWSTATDSALSDWDSIPAPRFVR